MKKLITFGVILAIIISAAAILFKIVSGAIGLISGLLNAVLAIAVIVATLLIVIWMFRFASKNK